jgi:hypothetical protein
MHRNALAPLVISGFAIAAALMIPQARAQVPGFDMDALHVKTGELNAASVRCELATQAEADALRAQGRAQVMQVGVDGARFDAGFDRGVRQLGEKWDDMSKAERERSCAELRKVHEQMKAAAAGMR